MAPSLKNVDVYDPFHPFSAVLLRQCFYHNTYRWPISCAIVNAVASPVSSITVHDLDGEQIEYFSARPNVSHVPSDVHRLCLVM